MKQLTWRRLVDRKIVEYLVAGKSLMAHRKNPLPLRLAPLVTRYAFPALPLVFPTILLSQRCRVRTDRCKAVQALYRLAPAFTASWIQTTAI